MKIAYFLFILMLLFFFITSNIEKLKKMELKGCCSTSISVSPLYGCIRSRVNIRISLDKWLACCHLWFSSTAKVQRVTYNAFASHMWCFSVAFQIAFGQNSSADFAEQCYVTSGFFEAQLNLWERSNNAAAMVRDNSRRYEIHTRWGLSFHF